jgi:ATP-dependent helicase YprA (DUF1998 family)
MWKLARARATPRQLTAISRQYLCPSCASSPTFGRGALMLDRGGLRKLLKPGLRLAEATPGHGDGSGCRVGRVAVSYSRSLL